MRKLLSGLALAALIAGTADAKPGGGNGHDNGKHGGGNPHAMSQGGGGGGPGDGHGKKEMRGPSMNGGGEQRAMRAQARPDKHAKWSGQQAAKAQAKADRAERKFDRKAGQAQRKVDRKAEQAQRKVERADRKAERAAARSLDSGVVTRAALNGDARRFSGRGRRLIDGCPPGLAKKYNGCMPPGLAKQGNFNGNTINRSVAAAAGGALLANTLTPTWFGYDDYGPDYRYYDGYLLRTNGDNVLGYVPLLGGALAPGEPWLSYFDPTPIPAYWTDYYGLNSPDRYRYYDDVIYELNPGYSEIDEIVALMAGDPWAVGRPMPYGYDVYNVPYSYRTRYYDGPDHWYRYSDGYVYDIDPTTRLVLAVVQLLT